MVHRYWILAQVSVTPSVTQLLSYTKISKDLLHFNCQYFTSECPSDGSSPLNETKRIPDVSPPPSDPQCWLLMGEHSSESFSIASSGLNIL